MKTGGRLFKTSKRLCKQACTCFNRARTCFSFMLIKQKQIYPNQPRYLKYNLREQNRNTLRVAHVLQSVSTHLNGQETKYTIRGLAAHKPTSHSSMSDFVRLLNCTNRTKSRKTTQSAQKTS